MAIPKTLRQQLGKRIVVARWYEGCLVLVSQAGWSDLMKRVTTGVDFVTAPVRDTDRFIMGSAFEVEPDDQGRVVIPQYLADYAKLATNVVFLGLGDRVEIWSKPLWDAREKYVTQNADELLNNAVSQSVSSVRKGGESR